MRIRRGELRRLAVVAGAAAAVLAGPGATGSALADEAVPLATAVHQKSCSAGGFTGFLRVTYNKPRPGAADYIYGVQYRINKGGNRGGNSANVYYTDWGVAPAKRLNAIDTAIQDNAYHYINPANDSYSRGTGNVGVSFIFDKSLGGDPRCGVSVTPWP